MRAVVQRVSSSSVKVDGKIVGSIDKGLNILLGIENEDNENDVKYLADKIINLRIFEDENDKMNLSILDKSGEVLVISQFTLQGDCRKGRRPSFINAARPEKAKKLYDDFLKYIANEYKLKVEAGVFQTHMEVDIKNDGPVTLLVDSKKRF
ncbi:D-aminoacyl-tRNA deacylase [Clostridiaceae bacterium HSG29]|nr:D-aminoacyl-tRNA deacylase [Clostridiaceae bacterium HSG29]